jgi:hypothetical protein
LFASCCTKLTDCTSYWSKAFKSWVAWFWAACVMTIIATAVTSKITDTLVLEYMHIIHQWPYRWRYPGKKWEVIQSVDIIG